MEQGPANSPQTNGLAKRFNETILMKMRCVLAQSNVPINYWDEAARYSSMLINLLPSAALGWKSPVHVHCLPPSKVAVRSKPLLFLGYEPYLDAGRFLDPHKRSVTVSRDFTLTRVAYSYDSCPRQDCLGTRANLWAQPRTLSTQTGTGVC